MDQKEYRKILIIDLKERGYKWDTVRVKDGEKPLNNASINQLKGIKMGLIKASKKALLKQVNQTLSGERQLTFDF